MEIKVTHTRCGYIGIIGRPNVGKSTLLNAVLGQKLSITCRKPQTTRHQILGIKTESNVQSVYVDTPGMHKKQEKAINRYMNKAASSILHDVDVVVFLIDGNWTPEEDWILERLKNVEGPVILVINKVDLIKDKAELLPLIEQLSKKMKFAEILPLSAKQKTQVAELEKALAKYLPEQDFIYPEDQITDRSQRFLAAEIIREKLMRSLGQELPYILTVEIDIFKEEGGIYDIAATIYVERDSQKAIIIGSKGQKLKQIGTEARLDMQKLFEYKVHLQLWVKVRENWADDERMLRQLGYE
ncbi:MAG: GTPase Era [Gammaproteobacteria bacterium]|jgi:GTP-binding protein Era|nr:GTPase Era [Gammaproteobacteria bacterium]